MTALLPELLSAKEAADYLRQKPDFVRDLVRRGVLDGYAIGGPVKRRIVIPRAALLAYLESCKVKKPKPAREEGNERSKPKAKANQSLIKQYAGRYANRASS